jgi:hypothetical protein
MGDEPVCRCSYFVLYWISGRRAIENSLGFQRCAQVHGTFLRFLIGAANAGEFLVWKPGTWEFRKQATPTRKCRANEALWEAKQKWKAFPEAE